MIKNEKEEEYQSLREKTVSWIIDEAKLFENKVGLEKAGIVYMLISATIFFIPSWFMRMSAFRSQWHTFIFWRGLVGLILSYILISWDNETAHVTDPTKFRLLIIRNMLASANQMFFYFQF